jgi:hypothetical protein
MDSRNNLPLEPSRAPFIHELMISIAGMSHANLMRGSLGDANIMLLYLVAMEVGYDRAEERTLVPKKRR